MGVQRQQQDLPESHLHQPFRIPSDPPTPALSDGSRGYDFPSSPPGSSSSWASPATSIDAPSPGVSHGLGRLTLGGRGTSPPGSRSSTPRNGLKNVPDQTEVEWVKDENQANNHVSEPNSKPEVAGMDVDT